MNGILEELYEHFEKKGVLEIQRILQNYMDDCGIGTLLKDHKLHIEIIHFLLNLLARHGLHLKLSKSVFLQPQMDFLGVCISKEGTTVDPAKVARLSEYPRILKDKRQVRRFLGIAGYHCMFCPNFSIIATPLTALTGKDVPFEWGPQQMEAQEKLITIITNAPALVRPAIRTRNQCITGRNGRNPLPTRPTHNQTGQHPETRTQTISGIPFPKIHTDRAKLSYL